MVKLHAVNNNVNLASKSGLTDIEVHTDSVTVLSWIDSVITDEKRIRPKVTTEMIVKCNWVYRWNG